MYVVVVEAKAPDSPKFNWKEFYRSVLEEMLEPAPDRKCDMEQRVHKLLKKQKAIGYELRSSFEETIKRRKVKVLIIDEAQHIAIGAGPKELLKHLDLVKSLANQSKTLIVLAGVYDLIDFRNLSGPLSRRTSATVFLYEGTKQLLGRSVSDKGGSSRVVLVMA